MKCIHCSDLHLDSNMSTTFGEDIAKIRRSELLHTFELMIDYAVQNNVSAILIVGDMFDSNNISINTRETVLYKIKNNPQINFYYLKGNHDNDNFLSPINYIPDNIKTFGANWKSYYESEEKISITGIELSSYNAKSAYSSLNLNSKKFNIVMLHGWALERTVEDNAEIINLKELRNKGIDYLALGHIHSYKKYKLDQRGLCCYSGCLEGRNFSECGEHGFVLLDIDENNGTFTHQFIPFAQRMLYSINVDVTNCRNTSELIDKADYNIKESGCTKDSLIKIILKGTLDVNCSKNDEHFLSNFKNQFYFVKVEDKTTLKVENEKYVMDKSLKGEFVRQVMNDDSIQMEDKAVIIRYGLQALEGEEIH